MRVYLKILTVLLVCLVFACGGDSTPITPFETLRAYASAVKKKDTKMMKFLLSKASLKIHSDQAKAQNTTVDEIILQETLFSVDQRIKHKRNEKIEGDTATIEVKNSFGGWDLIYFVKEDGIWKIDKKGFSDNTIEQNDADNQKLDDLINQGKKDSENNLENSNTNVNGQDSNSDPSFDSNQQTDPNDPSIKPDATPDDTA